jgi:MFS family permease
LSDPTAPPADGIGDLPRPDQVGGAEPLAPGATPPPFPTSLAEVRDMIDAHHAPEPSLAAGGVTTMEMDAFVGKGTTVVDLAKKATFGWWPVFVLAFVAIIDRMEQSVLAGALSEIQADFNVSDTAAGALSTATGIAALLLVIPAGFIADRVLRTKAIALILALWSLLSLGTGLAGSFAVFFTLRVILGGASVLNNPMAGSLISDYYPRASRGRAYSIERLFYFLGNPVGIIVGGVVAEVFGWRWVFLGLVLPGLVIALLAFFLKDPKRGTADRIDLERERRGLVERLDEVKPKTKEPEVDLLSSAVWTEMRKLLHRRTLRLVLISQGLLYLGLGGLFFWTPSFFQRAYDLESGAASGIAGGMGMVGILVGFGLALRLGDRYVGTRAGWRLLLGSIGISLGALGLFGLATANILPLSILSWITLNIGFFLSVPTFTAALADLSGASRRGQTFALATLVISLTTSVGPVIIGRISDWAQSSGIASEATSLRYSFATLTIPVVIGVFVALRARTTFDADADEARRSDPAVQS